MAKEWDKFQAEYKKLQPKIKKYTSTEASKMHSRIKKSLVNAWEGEDYFRESMAKARENGVKSEKLADFMKDKDFKDGLTTWNKSVDMHQGEVRVMTEYCSEAASLHKQMAGLLENIDKDLKKRKGSSESKKDIETLQSTLTKDTAEIKKTTDAIGKLNAAEKMYAVNFKRTVDKIMKESAASQSGKKDATELPQLLVDRVLKKNTGAVVKLSKSIAALCDSAISKAGVDLKDALPDLKTAAGQIKSLKKISDNYQLVKKKFPGIIKDSKDGKKILETIKKFEALYTASERKLRGTTVTIKKAAG